MSKSSVLLPSFLFSSGGVNITKIRVFLHFYFKKTMKYAFFLYYCFIYCQDLKLFNLKISKSSSFGIYKNQHYKSVGSLG